MMKSRYRQRGLTFYGWVFVISVLGFLVYAGIKSFPVYMKYFEIRQVIEWAANQPGMDKASVAEIRNRIQRRFDSGYVRNISSRDVKVIRTKQGRKLSVEYEKREHFIANVDVVYVFKVEADLKKSP